jgi:hypothetical protein
MREHDISLVEVLAGIPDVHEKHPNFVRFRD